jgi:hypothetical protein
MIAAGAALAWLTFAQRGRGWPLLAFAAALAVAPAVVRVTAT